MDISHAKYVKEILESFPNTKVNTIINNTIIIENTKTHKEYEISFFEDENFKVIIDTTNAKLINSPKTLKDEFFENCQILNQSIKNVFTENNIQFNKNIKKLKQAIIELPHLKENDIKNIFEDLNQKNQLKDINTFKKTNLYIQLEEKINNYNVYKTEFEKMLNIFDENNEIIENQYIDLKYIKEALQYLINESNIYFEKVEKFNIFMEQLSKILPSEKLIDIFFEDFNFNDIMASITKKLVKINKNYNEDINIVDNIKKIYQLFENNNVFDFITASQLSDNGASGTPSPTIFNLAADTKFRPKFFKFKIGIYTPEDIKIMLNELNNVMQTCDLSDEDLELISSFKKTLNYMFYTGQINDHIITEIIMKFNERFANDKSVEFNDPTQQLGWQNIQQQRENLPQGFSMTLA